MKKVVLLTVISLISVTALSGNELKNSEQKKYYTIEESVKINHQLIKKLFHKSQENSNASSSVDKTLKEMEVVINGLKNEINALTKRNIKQEDSLSDGDKIELDNQLIELYK